jgi:hypothetical protein
VIVVSVDTGTSGAAGVEVGVRVIDGALVGAVDVVGVAAWVEAVVTGSSAAEHPLIPNRATAARLPRRDRVVRVMGVSPFVGGSSQGGARAGSEGAG